jgi:thioredoxin reductase
VVAACEGRRVSDSEVVIVGAGPAGLGAAIALSRRGVRDVVVLDREAAAGGTPRHTDHIGFGLRDLHRMMRGPVYARRLRETAERAGAQIRTGTTVLGWAGPTSLRIADANGIAELGARAVVLATGVRERPRAARLVPGDRGAGIMTTGALQQLTMQGIRPGEVAVIVGAEHVSFSAVLTLRHAGCRVAAMVTPLQHHQTYTPLRLATSTRHRVPIITGEAIASIEGRDQVRAVTLTSGRRIECDTVVFTGDWVPNNELARSGDLTLDAHHRGPVVDSALRTSRRGVFAAGNLTHPAETADVCALQGRHLSASLLDWLATGHWPEHRVAVRAEPPILWISPSMLHGQDPAPRDRFVLRVSEFGEARRIEVTQGERTLWHGNIVGSLVPNRSLSIAADWVDIIDPDAGEIVVRLRD